MAREDHGIEHEPAFHGVVKPERDPSEAKAQQQLNKQAKRDAKYAYEHAVHDELALLPADHANPIVIDRDFACVQCGYNLRGTTLGQPCPECDYVQYQRPSRTDRIGYAQWLTQKVDATSAAKTWAVVAVVIVLSGLWSVFGAFWHAGAGGLSNMSALFSVALWGPVVEEVMKIALAAVIIERAPYLFKSRVQILVAAAGAGLMFAVIENFLYLLVYVPDPPIWLVAWRWTVCVALHVGCTLVAGIGAAKVWQIQMTQHRRMPVPVDMRYLVAAIVIHGLYNGSVTIAELSGVF